MATETLFPNGDDNGWPTGDWTDIDEGIASADGATYETNVDNDVTLIDLDDSARSDSDTINSVTVKIRAKDTGAGGKNSLIVDLFIGGTGLGATPAQVLNNSYATYTFTSVLWDLDHTAAELDGMQVEITANQTGMGTAADWQIDAIDVDIDYTAGVSNNTEEPGVKNLLLDEKTPSVIEGYNRFPDKDTLLLDGKIPAVTYDWVIPVAQDTLQITEQTPTRLLAEFITPDAGSLTLTAKVPNRARRVFITGYEPTVGISINKQPGPDTLQITGEIPLVGQSITIVVPTGTLTLTGEIPTIEFDWVVFPAQDEIVITGQSPDRIINHIRGPPQETLALNGQVPTIGIDVVKTPAPDTLVLNGLTPTTTTNHIQAPATETLVLTGQIPTLAFDWVITPGIETLNLTGSIPAVTSSQAEVPDPGSLTLTGQTPTLVYDWVITPDQGTLALTGEIPTLDNSIPPAAESLILTGEIPTVDSGGGDVTRDPATKALSLTGETPALAWTISTTAGTLALTGQTPQRPSKYNLVGYAPTIDIEEIAIPGTGSLVLTGEIPTISSANANIVIVHPQTYVDDDYVNQDYIVDAATSLTLSGSAPTIDSIGASPSIPVPTGSLSISSVRPVIAEDKTADPGTGSLNLTGQSVRRPWEVRLTGYAPELSFGSGTATPDADTLALTGYEPFAVVDSAGGTSRSPATKAVTITGYSPATTIFIANADASLQLTGYIPSKAFGSFTVKDPAQGSLSLTGQTPQAVSTLKPLPGKGSVNLTGYAPSAGVNVIGVDTGSVTLNGSVPTLVYDWTISPSTKSLNLTGYVPTKSFGFFITKSPTQKALALTGQQPNVSSRTTPVGSLSLTGLAPTLDSGVFPGKGEITLTGYQTPVNIGNDITIQVPTKQQGAYVDPDYVQPDYVEGVQHSIALTGLRPGAVVESFDWIATPDTVTLGLTGYNLFIDNGGRNKKAFIVRPDNRTKVVKPRKYITVIKPEHRK